MLDRRDILTGLALGVAMYAFYALAAPTGLVGADNGEFVTLAHTDGIAHPPGYPLYVVFLRATSWFPGVSPAHGAALATSILGACSIALLYFAMRRWQFSGASAAVAAAIVGLDLTVLSLNAHAEVFALNHLFAAAIFWAAAPQGAPQGLRRAALLGLLGGLALCNHHSIAFLAPVGFYGLFLANREHEGSVWTPLAAAAALFAAGLMPYLYLLAAPALAGCANCLSWGEVRTAAELADHFLRADYGTTQLGIGGARDPIAQWGAFGELLFGGSFGVIAIAATVGALYGLRRRSTATMIFGACFVATGLVLLGLFNTDPTGIGAQIVSRFYGLPILCLAPLVAIAFDSVRQQKVAQIVGLSAAVGLSFVNVDAVQQQHTGAIDAYLHDTMSAMPRDAVLFGTGDHRFFGMAYHQLVLGERADVLYVDAGLLAYDWYLEALERRSGMKLPRTDARGIPIGDTIDAFVASGRPTFATHLFTDAVAARPTYPLGTALAFASPTNPPTPPGQLAAKNAELFAGFQLDRPLSEVRDPWEREVYQHYARTWNAMATALSNSGDPGGASKARQMATLYEDPKTDDRAEEP